ncbi:glycosyltransferase [bacterium]|nr:glycosyltransferase [bacterium]
MIIIAVLTGVVLIVYLVMSLLYLIGLFLPARNNNLSQPFVSVLIAARNEQNNIIRCLESVVNQTYPKDLFEVIVIDDRSADNTALLVSEFSRLNLHVKMICVSDKPEKISGKKNALSIGINESKGEILLFTDADCRVKDSWVAGMVSCFLEDVGVVIGYSEVESKTFFERWQELDFLTLMSAACGITNLGFPLAASGQNLAYRRKAFDAVGGFEKIIERISGDDTLMIQLIKRYTSYRTVFSGHAGTFNTTLPMNTLYEFIQQRARWASNGTIMLRLNPLFFFYLLSIYCLHFLLVAGLALSAFHVTIMVITAFVWITKGIVDFAVTFHGAHIFKKKYSFTVFVAWFFLQTPLVLWVGIKGALGYFKWK